MTGGFVASVARGYLAPDRPSDAYRDIYVPEGKVVVSLTIDDGNSTDYTTLYPLFTARNLPMCFAINSQKPGIGGRMTWANIIDARDHGMEILNHSRNHGADPANFAELYDEIIGAQDDFAAQNVRADSFVAPGTWVAAYYWDTAAKLDGTGTMELLRSRFASATSYINDGNAATRNFKLRNPIRKFGIFRGVPLDSTTLATFKLDYNAAAAFGGVINCSGHVSGIDTTILGTILDFLVTERDAGRCEILTQTASLFAQRGERENLLTDGDFHLDVTGTFVGWTPAGSPTVTAADSPTGGKSVTTPDASNTVKVNVPARDLRTVEIQFVAKNAVAGVNGNARLILRSHDSDTNTDVTDLSLTSGHTTAPGWPNLTDTWQTYRAYVNIDPRTEYLTIWPNYSANAGRVGGWKIADIKVFKS